MNSLKDCTQEEKDILKRLRTDTKMREAVGLHIGKAENTVRQWACYRPWMLTNNPAALEKAKQFIEANKLYDEAQA